MCSWGRRDARRVPYIARFICHMYPASSSPRGGYIAIGSSCGSCACQNATLMSHKASTRVCRPLWFLIDAALEALDGSERCCACECIKSDSVGNFHRNEPAAHEWSICSLFRLLQPLTSDLLASSQCDRHTFEQLMSDHCFTLSLSTNFYQMWSQQFTRLVVRQLVSRRSHVWQHNSQEHRQQGGWEEKREHTGSVATVRCLLLSPPVPLFPPLSWQEV